MSGEIIWSPGMSLDAIEKIVILKAYSFFKNNKTATSASLGIAIRTLDSKLDRYEQEQKLEEERQENEHARRTEFLARQRGNPPNNIGLPYSPIPALHGAISGPRMESITNAASEHAMSLSKREEVQVVLSKQTPASNPKKNR